MPQAPDRRPVGWVNRLVSAFGPSDSSIRRNPIFDLVEQLFLRSPRQKACHLASCGLEKRAYGNRIIH